MRRARCALLACRKDDDVMQVGAPGGIVGARAVHCRGTTRARTANLIVLGVVEKVEVLPTEVDRFRLPEGEALEQAEVEVQAARQMEGVAPDVSERESRRQSEGRGVIKQRPSNPGNVGLHCCMGVTDEVRPRTSANAISHTGTITKASTVGNAERHPSLGDGDA